MSEEKKCVFCGSKKIEKQLEDYFRCMKCGKYMDLENGKLIPHKIVW